MQKERRWRLAIIASINATIWHRWNMGVITSAQSNVIGQWMFTATRNDLRTLLSLGPYWQPCRTWSRWWELPLNGSEKPSVLRMRATGNRHAESGARETWVTLPQHASLVPPAVSRWAELSRLALLLPHVPRWTQPGRRVE